MGTKIMKATITTTPMADSSRLLGLACVLGGAAIMALSIACGRAGDGAGSTESAKGGEPVPEGRSFADQTPMEARPDLVAKADDARATKGTDQPVGISGLAESLDPALLGTAAAWRPIAQPFDVP